MSKYRFKQLIRCMVHGMAVLVSSFRATLLGHMQTYCPLCPRHQEPHTLLPSHTNTTITAAISLFVCYRQLWYSLPCCAVCFYGVLCGKHPVVYTCVSS